MHVFIRIMTLESGKQMNFWSGEGVSCWLWVRPYSMLNQVGSIPHDQAASNHVVSRDLFLKVNKTQMVYIGKLLSCLNSCQNWRILTVVLLHIRSFPCYITLATFERLELQHVGYIRIAVWVKTLDSYVAVIIIAKMYDWLAT